MSDAAGKAHLDCWEEQIERLLIGHPLMGHREAEKKRRMAYDLQSTLCSRAFMFDFMVAAAFVLRGWVVITVGEKNLSCSITIRVVSVDLGQDGP